MSDIIIMYFWCHCVCMFLSGMPILILTSVEISRLSIPLIEFQCKLRPEFVEQRKFLPIFNAKMRFNVQSTCSWSNSLGVGYYRPQGAFRNYVDKQGGGRGSHKCQRYYINLFSKLVNEGGGGQKSSKFCQRSLWMPLMKK